MGEILNKRLGKILEDIFKEIKGKLKKVLETF